MTYVTYLSEFFYIHHLSLCTR